MCCYPPLFISENSELSKLSEVEKSKQLYIYICNDSLDSLSQQQRKQRTGVFIPSSGEDKYEQRGNKKSLEHGRKRDKQ